MQGLPSHMDGMARACPRITRKRQRLMTQEQCEHAVKVLQAQGIPASYVQGAPDDHGVWLESVWNQDLGEAFEFRIHDEEIEYLQKLNP